MPPSDEEEKLELGPNGLLTKILVQAKATHQGVEYLKQEVREVKEQIKGTVPRTECQLQHKNVTDALTRVEQVLAKKQTGQAHSSITAAMIASGVRTPEDLTGPYRTNHDTNPNLSVDEIQVELKKREEEAAEKKRRAFMFYLSAAGGLFALLGTLGVSVYKIITYMNKLDERMSVQTQEIKKGTAAQAKVVYVPIPRDTANTTVVDDSRDEDKPTPVPPKRYTPKKAAKKAVKKDAP